MQGSGQELKAWSSLQGPLRVNIRKPKCLHQKPGAGCPRVMAKAGQEEEQKGGLPYFLLYSIQVTSLLVSATNTWGDSFIFSKLVI